MEEYLATVMEQIRCKTVRPFIERELRNHIEDQIEDNIKKGMEYEEGVNNAIKDMGDPVETGISLDRIHRPQIAWGMIALVAIMSAFSVALHYTISRNGVGYECYISSKAPFMYVVGFIIMIAVYFIDYTFIARFSKPIAIILLLLCLYCRFRGLSVNGSRVGIKVSGLSFSVEALLMLYVPVFAGILYKYRNTGLFGLIKSIGWMIAAVLLVFELPALVTSLIMLISMLTLLTLAITKGWFNISKPISIIALWGVFVGLPVIALVVMFFGDGMADYQKDRIIATLSNSGNENYAVKFVRDILSSSKLIGNNSVDVANTIPAFNSDYVLTYISSTYGLIAGTLIACMLIIIIGGIFGITFKQKNQLGMMIGCGSGMVLLLTTFINVFENIGKFPPTKTFLPLVSAGRSYTVVTYVLIGIVLSVHRYKCIYPKHVSMNMPQITFTLKAKI